MTAVRAVVERRGAGGEPGEAAAALFQAREAGTCRIFACSQGVVESGLEPAAAQAVLDAVDRLADHPRVDPRGRRSVLLLTDPCDDRQVTVDAARPLPVLLLPGLDGSGRLFRRFLAVATGALDFRPVPYPRDRFLDYARARGAGARRSFPRGPFAILGESFGGPLALRVAASAPRGLVGVVLVATFHRRPARPVLARATPLAPAFFRLPLPPHVVRLLLAGGRRAAGAGARRFARRCASCRPA